MLSVAAVVVATALFLIIFGGPSGSPATSTLVDETPSQASAPVTENFSGQGTLQSLMALAPSVECSITYEVTGAPSVTGTYFVHDGQIRGDFLTTVPELGGDVLSSLIMKDGVMYTWSDIGGQQYGMKVTIDATTPDTALEGREPIPQDAPITYDCRVWTTIDNSIFMPPTTVIFQDMSSLLDAGMEYGTLYTE